MNAAVAASWRGLFASSGAGSLALCPGVPSRPPFCRFVLPIPVPVVEPSPAVRPNRKRNRPSATPPPTSSAPGSQRPSQPSAQLQQQQSAGSRGQTQWFPPKCCLNISTNPPTALPPVLLRRISRRPDQQGRLPARPLTQPVHEATYASIGLGLCFCLCSANCFRLWAGDLAISNDFQLLRPTELAPLLPSWVCSPRPGLFRQRSLPNRIA